MRLGLGLAITNILRVPDGSAPAWTPASLFESSEQGAWYYIPDDFSTLWQDTAGTTPVTATGQSVARWDDSSGNGNTLVQGTPGSRPTLQQDASGAYYLDFDGSDDYLSSASAFVLSASNKITVTAAFHKEAEGSAGMVAELGTSSSVNGSFYLAATTAFGTYAFAARGTSGVSRNAITYEAPHSAIVTARADISGPLTSIEVNASGAPVSSANSLGSGNFSATNTLYVGRRAGSSLPLGGKLYGLVIRGASSSSDDQRLTEQYLATHGALWVLGGNGGLPWHSRSIYMEIGGEKVIGYSNYGGIICVRGESSFNTIVDVGGGDDHSGASFLKRAQDNKILVFTVGRNIANLWVSVSDNANDVSSLGSATDIASEIGGTSIGYVTPVQLTGEANSPIYLFTRNGSGWGYTKSLDGGESWAAIQMITGGSNYIAVCQNGSSRIDVAATDYGPSDSPYENGIYHFYYENGAFYTSSGVEITSPPFTTSEMTQVWDGATYNANILDIAVDGTGAPCILFVKYLNTTTWDENLYSFARWNGSSWDVADICDPGTYLYAAESNYMGGACFNPDNPLEVVCSREVSGKWDLWKYTSSDSGATWGSGTQITSNTHTYSVRPAFIRGASSQKSVAYVRGTYVTYSDLTKTWVDFVDVP